ncbi:hypothetical protein DICPUDRAFT_150090 [Dictyostelium purpureum]|uniref:arginine--tRNA ligase n=1 Tax=Dictyostelium purpureum TaxID=5786 RepID=F0ZFF1_DICPU|nr:uncharacterized protein DICPUDRAFT_150090 [Dictyostelium purpureum]EGC37324.1 hypothetical protein DICPUDRAFT_150090 [Dictyostelium purpureum]|eukprot:XP_003286138.1 hypothetical protein DICPUDRAFT_150090 [Dictyostelium purpureum]
MIKNSIIINKTFINTSLFNNNKNIFNNNNNNSLYFYYSTITQFNRDKKWFDLYNRSPYLLLHSCFKGIFDKALTQEEKEMVFNNKKIKFQPQFSQVPSKKIVSDFDYAINNLVVASMLLNKKDKNNDYISKKIIDTFESKKKEFEFSEMIEKIEIGSKGYLNLRVSEEYLLDILNLWIKGHEGKGAEADKFKIKNLIYNENNKTDDNNKMLPLRSKKVLVDFASPNMSKELHVGHLRSIALGESVCRILEYMGHDVERISHAGDFGTPMGIVIAHSLETKQPFLRHIWDKEYKGEIIIPTPKELSDIYSESKARTKTDPEFNKRTLASAAELQKGPPTPDGGGSDPDIYNAWIALCDASRIGFNQVFDMMNINVNERGESFYREMLPKVIDELTEKGFVKLSEGRKCIFLFGEDKTPVIVQKSDGAYLYATTDLAAIKHRVENDKQWIVYITDDSQSDHFEQIFKIAENAKWLDLEKTRVDHLSFGVVRGSNGSKLSSRDGSPVALIDLLHESIERAKQATSISKSFTRAEKIDSDQNARDITVPRYLDSDETLDDVTDDHFQKIGLGALKYFDLTHRNNSYIFSYDNMLSFKGNTSIYILYCYTRISTLFKRANFNIDQINLNEIDFTNLTEKERNLIFLFSRFSDVLKSTEQNLRPGLICDYLWEIANSFHQLYESEKFIGSERQNQKLLICYATQRILSTGLNLLGVETVEKL